MLLSLLLVVPGVWLRAYAAGYVRKNAELTFTGPYAYTRNPLYLGSWLLALGVSVLMPPSGAAFFLVAFSAFVLLLIQAEERFLSTKQGDLYQQYRRTVPRLWPRVSGGNAATTAARPRWVQALLAETYPVAITLCFAVLAWRYNARILIQCVLICYGVSLVVRALTGKGVEGRV